MDDAVEKGGHARKLRQSDAKGVAQLDVNPKRRALVALGTNAPFDGRAGVELLTHALAALSEAGLTVENVSRAWRTAPWPPSDQRDYVNAVVALDAGDRTPRDLYEALAAIEDAFGRERVERWGPRTLDLDIIDLGGAIGAFDGIVLPHPRAHERAFVLAPLGDVAPDWRHPVLGRSAADLRAGLPPGQEVTALENELG
jgi:2-amino-4-hydroxy-6-hydroxymethyldihydropteridine diphosphokinase